MTSNEDITHLIDEYANLKKRKDEIEIRMEFIKTVLVDFSKRQSTEIVYGSECFARIKILERLRFPRKNDADRNDLENIIKNAGLWEDVSSLNTMALEKIIKYGAWNQDLLEKLRKFYTPYEMSIIFLKRKF